MGETGLRGKGRDDVRWEDDLLLVVYIRLFFFFSFFPFYFLVSAVGTNWLNDTRMPGSARSLTVDWGGLVKEGKRAREEQDWLGVSVSARCRTR